MLSSSNAMEIRRWLAAVGVMTLALVAGSGTVLAGHRTDAIDSYTGCLSVKGGTLTHIKSGDAPLHPCGANQTEVHLSGGDITELLTGEGLTGGASSGAAAVALAPTFRLPQTCTSGEVAKWDGTTWNCAEDDTGAEYTAGTGLALNGTEFSLHHDYRLPQGCAAGEAAGFGPTMFSLGDWQCTQYTYGGETCPSGQFARATGDDGSLLCASPAPSGSTTLEAFSAAQPTFNTGMGLPDDNQYRVVASIAAPAGTYFVTAKGVLRSEGTIKSFSSLSSCRIVGQVELDRIDFSNPDLRDEHEETFSLNGVGATTGEPLTLECRAGQGGDGLSVHNGRIVALKVG